MIDTYKDRHLGETCAILLNGRSVTAFKAKTWPHAVIGTNRSWEVAEAPYHCVIDKKQLLALAGHPLGLLFVGIDKNEEETARKRRLYPSLRAAKIIELPGWTERYGAAFITDLHKPIWLPNVGIMALELGYWMGFRRFDIWGLDLQGCKFWDPSWVIGESTAKLQDTQFRFVARVLRRLDVQVINHNPRSLCGAFPKKELSHGGNAEC